MAGALWVVTQNDGTVRRFDGAGAPAATVKVGAEPRLIAAGTRRLWVSVYGDDAVVPVDPATGRAEPAIKVCDGPQGLAEEGGLVWVACTTAEQVAVIDATTRAVVATLPLQGSPDAVLASGGRVYVLSQAGPVVTGFDPATRAPNGVVIGGDSPGLNDRGNDDLVISGDRIWMSRFDRNDVIAVHLPG